MQNIYVEKDAAAASYHPTEDAAAWDIEKGIFIVADGVTRDKKNGIYPDPSPARLAADAVCAAAMEALKNKDKITETRFLQAFASANIAVQGINKKLGLYEHCDYLQNDLAGAVAALAIKQSTYLYWGYIGDCGVATIDREGAVTWQTNDDVSDVRPFFPGIHSLGASERMVTIRKEYRNNPSAGHPTYGVLTGESTALQYVKTGRRRLQPHDNVLVFSDGARSLLQNKVFCRLLQADQQAVHEALRTLRSNGELEDETTLLIV